MIIGLTGKKGSGKTAVFDIIKNNFNVSELALADYLKKTCSIVFDIEMEYFHVPELKEVQKTVNIDKSQLLLLAHLYGIRFKADEFNKHLNVHLNTPRKLLQYIGTEILREKDKNIHIKQMLSNNKLSANHHYVISDIRFENEWYGISTMLGDKLGFECFYVDRSDVENKDLHKSEQEFGLFKEHCKIINNSGDLEDLKKEVVSKIQNVLTYNSGVI